VSRASIRDNLSPKSSPRHTPRSPVSSRLQTSPRKRPDSELAQQKIELSAATYVTASNQRVSLLPMVAQSASGLFVDVEGNQLSSAALSKLGRNIACLNLNRNPIVDFTMPLLKQLRSLTLDNCNLTSFRGIPFFSDLRYLSVADNKIQSYDGLHIFPRLVYVELSGNPVDFSPILTVQAFGSIYLKTVNGIDLTEADLRAAFAMTPLVGEALRKGRDPTPRGSADEELAASQSFLTADLVD